MDDGPARERWGAREVVEELKIADHVLRYWEQCVPLVRARRNDAGRREWTAAQMRLLRRFRHLVVDRGINVTAAGDRLVGELGGAGEPVRARVHAAAENLARSLQHLRSDGSAAGGPTDGEAADTLDLLPQLARCRRAIPAGDALRIADAPPPVRRARGRGEVHPAEGCALLLFAHAGTWGPWDATARVLGRVLAARLHVDAPDASVRPIVVAAPPGTEALLTEAVSVARPDAPVYCLPVPDLSAGRGRYRAALLASLWAVAHDDRFDRWLRDNRCDAVSLWVPDRLNDPPAPFSLVHAARSSERGLAVAISADHAGLLRVRDSVAIIPERSRRFWTETLASGRWSWGSVRDSVPRQRINGEGEDADRYAEGWTYRLWIRDLLRVEPRAVVLASPPGDVP